MLLTFLLYNCHFNIYYSEGTLHFNTVFSPTFKQTVLFKEVIVQNIVTIGEIKRRGMAAIEVSCGPDEEQ